MTDPRDEPTRVDAPGGDPTRLQGPVGPPPAGPGPGGPPREGPDRRVWIIVALLAVIAVLLALLLLSDDDGDDEATGDTSTSLATTTSSSTSTTEPPTSTTDAPGTSAAPPVTLDPDDCAAAGEGPAQPGLAAETVFEAWTLGDEACADLLMTDDALAELFSRDGTGATDQFQGCTEVDQPDPHADCAFTYEGGATHYLLQFSPTDGWQVFDIDQVAD